MQCTRPQAADGLARRRRIDQEMGMEKQTQPQQKWIRKRSSSRNEARVPAAVGPVKIISCK